MMLALLTAVSLAGIVPPEAPQVGESTTIQVLDGAEHPIPGVSVRIIYRPDTHSANEVNAGLTDGGGKLAWTPIAAGPVVIRALDAEARVMVPATQLPVETWLLLLFSLAASGAAVVFGLSPFSRAS